MGSWRVLFIVVLVCVGRALSQCYTNSDCTGEIMQEVSGEYACCVDSIAGLSHFDGENCVKCIVHGFDQGSYDLDEGQILSLSLHLNVKGGTRFNLELRGTVMAEPGGSADSTDYVHVLEMGVIRIEAKSDSVSLEYDEFVVLNFIPSDDENFVSDLSTREYFRSNTTVNIIDINRLELTLQSCEYQITEESVLLQPILVFYDGATQNDFSLTFRSTEGVLSPSESTTNEVSLAKEGGDFNESSITVLVPRSEYAGRKEIEVPQFLNILDNDINELEKRFIVIAELGDEIRNNTGYFQRQDILFSTNDTLEIRIIDNDPMFVGFAQRSVTVSERADFDSFILPIAFEAVRTSELEYITRIQVVESISTAIVAPINVPGITMFDATFGVRDNPEDPIREDHSIEAGTNYLQGILRVSLTDDLHIEPDECFTLTASTRNDFGQSAPCNDNDDDSATSYFCEHTVCIEDDDEPFVVGFVQTTHTVLESIGSVSICVNLTRPLVDILDESVYVSVTDYPESSTIPQDSVLATPDMPDPMNGVYSMEEGTDYAQQTLPYNLIDDEEIWELMRVVCYNQLIYDDMRLEGDEYAGLTLAVDRSNIITLLNPDQAAILIVDDNDVAVVGMDRSIVSVAEDSDLVEVCARVISPSIQCPIQFAFNVSISTVDGTAEGMLDYEPISTILLFESCETHACVNISILRDLIQEQNESFTITLERTPELDPRIILDPLETQIVILGQCASGCDGVPVVVGFEFTTYSVDEDDGMVEVAVVVTEPFGGAPQPFSLSLSTKDGTAFKSEDYQGLNNEIMEFNIGDVRMTHSVLINQNLMCDEDLEFFQVQLSLYSGTLPTITISPSTAHVFISDPLEVDCNLIVGLEMMTQEVSENVGAIDVCVSVTGPISYCPIEFDFNIDIHTTDGNAEGDQDYEPLSRTLSFVSCDTQLCVNIRILSDLIQEPDEYFSVVLERTSELDSRIALDPAEGQIVIQGQCASGCDEVPIVVGFQLTIYNTSEREEKLEVSVVIMEPSSGGTPRPFSLVLSTEDGTALSHQDYGSVDNEVLQFSEGDDQLGYTLTVNRDEMCEQNIEDFFVQLSLYSGTLPVSISQSRARIIISDYVERDCQPVVSLERELYRAQRDPEVVVCVIVSKPDLSCPVDSPFSVRVETTDGNAVSDLDYEPLSTTVQFESCETKKCVNISIVGYEVFEPEPSEVFNVNLLRTADLDPGITLGLTQAQVVIPGGCLGVCDYEAPIVVEFDSASYTVSEADGMVQLFIEVPGGAPRPFSVSLRTENNTAIETEDYTAVNEILQFDLGQDMKVFTVMIQQDQRCEEASEDFFAHLFLYENLAPVLRSTAQVIIRDTDCVAVVGMEEEVKSVSEGVGEVEVCIKVTLPDDECPIPFSFNISLSTTDGTAESGSDYLSLSTIVQFQPCDIRKCLNISIVSDLVEEDEEFFQITLDETPDLFSRIILDPRDEQIIILAQCTCGCNRVPIVVGFENATYTGSESDEMVQLSIVVTDPPLEGAPRPFSLSLSTDEGSSDIVQFERGQQRLVHNMTVLQDDLCEGAHNITISLSMYSGVHPMTVEEPSAQILVDDCEENECANMLAEVCEMAQDIPVTPSPTDSSSFNFIYVYTTAPVAFALLIIIVVLIATVVGVRRRRKKVAISDGYHIAFDPIDTLPSLHDVFDEIRSKVNKGMVFHKDNIHLSKVVGQGETGIVYMAFLDTVDGSELVAIKTVKALFASSDVSRLSKEIKLMVSFNHPNVMTLRGVCLDQENPLLIMPFMTNGNLLAYVRQNKNTLMFDNEADPQMISSARKLLLGMCLQVAKGMQYLADLRVVHRDLAARNCMIDVNGVIKIADFGLTEDMYITNYFRKEICESENEEKVPIRWMAPESINGQIYNEKTDVWSFGVTCWEVFTCGQVPYHGLPVLRLPGVLATGERLDKPVNTVCTDEIFSIISWCWKNEQEERPTFSDLVQEISSVLETEAGYLDISKIETSPLETSVDNKQEQIGNVHESIM